jgi:hypothetical protein
MMPVSIKPAEVAPHTPSQRAASELPTASPTSSGSEDASDAAALAQTWADMVVHMGLKAFAGQLARQSELVLLTETAMVLRCEKLSLATDDNALSGLRSALKTYFTAQGKPVPTLKVDIAELGQVRNSPQKTSAKQRDDSLASAKQAVQQHPTIAAIVREFDGMILPNSIQPE